MQQRQEIVGVGKGCGCERAVGQVGVTYSGPHKELDHSGQETLLFGAFEIGASTHIVFRNGCIVEALGS